MAVLAALIVAGIFGVLFVVSVVMLFIDYDRTMRALGGIAMFIHSIRKKPEPAVRRHRRSGESEEHAHRRRVTPQDPAAQTIRQFATPPHPHAPVSPDERKEKE